MAWDRRLQCPTDKALYSEFPGWTQEHEGQLVMMAMRLAGPLAPFTMKAASDQFKRFWESGVTDDGIHDTTSAKHANPTFAFSMSGDKVAVYYGTDPILGFHLAETLASAGCPLSDESTAIHLKMVQAARHQFDAWSKAVMERIQDTRASSASLVVRMYAGEHLHSVKHFIL